MRYNGTKISEQTKLWKSEKKLHRKKTKDQTGDFCRKIVFRRHQPKFDFSHHIFCFYFGPSNEGQTCVRTVITSASKQKVGSPKTKFAPKKNQGPNWRFFSQNCFSSAQTNV